MIYLTPLFGSLISTLFMIIYAGIESSIKLTEIFDLLSIFPITFILISIISYALCIPIGYFLIKIKDDRFWSDGFFMFISSLVGTLLGLVFCLIILKMGATMMKIVFVFLSFFMGATFTSSFYITLKKEINKLEKQK